MSETYYVKTFGGLEITNDNVTVNIVELFGHVKYCVETNNCLFNGHRSISNIK